MQKSENLDKLIMEHGTEFDSNINKIIESQDLLNKMGGLAYDDAEIIPGGNAVMPTSEEVTLNKEDADENFIQNAAMLKLAKEQETFNKMSDDEKIKDYICQSQYYKETNDFYHKYGYEMSGKQKRFTKRAIETAWKKGKFKITPEQREDILFELSKASHQQRQTQPNDTQKTQQGNVSEHIADLNSLIFRQQ